LSFETPSADFICGVNGGSFAAIQVRVGAPAQECTDEARWKQFGRRGASPPHGPRKASVM